jgi:hypothetical protein
VNFRAALICFSVKSQSLEDKDATVATSSASEKLAKKARKLGMNNDMRRSIFYTLATCDVSTCAAVRIFVVAITIFYCSTGGRHQWTR